MIRYLLLLLALGGLAGCFDLDTADRVKDLRVLAVCADTPQVFVAVAEADRASGLATVGI